MEKTVELSNSVFEVSHILDDTVFLTDLRTERSYPVKGLPCHLIFPGMLLDGLIGRRDNHIYWNWFITESVFPNRARKYIIFV